MSQSDVPTPHNRPFKYDIVVNSQNAFGIGINNYLSGIERYGAIDGMMYFWKFQSVHRLPGTYQECIEFAVPLTRLVSIRCTRVSV